MTSAITSRKSVPGLGLGQPEDGSPGGEGATSRAGVGTSQKARNHVLVASGG